MAKASKGSAFERSLCRTLSEWWTQDLKEPRSDVFWRTAGSGARATTRRKGGSKTANSHGDVMALDPLGQPFLDVFTLEIKRGYSRSTIADLLDKPKGAATQVYESWIQQAIASQRAAGSLYWLLIVKRDKRDVLVYFPHEAALNLGGIYSYSVFLLLKEKVAGKVTDIIGMRLSEFLREARPSRIRQLARET